MKKNLIKIMACVMMAGSLVACGEKKDEAKEPVATTAPAPVVRDDAKAEELFTPVKEALGDNYWPTEKIEGEQAAELYGITLDNTDEIVAEVPRMATNADLLLVVKAKEGKVEDVKKEVDAFRESKVADTMQYPMNIQKIAASRVDVIGNYVIYTQLGGENADLETDEAIKAGCEADNKTAVDAIEKVLKAQQ